MISRRARDELRRADGNWRGRRLRHLPFAAPLDAAKTAVIKVNRGKQQVASLDTEIYLRFERRLNEFIRVIIGGGLAFVALLCGALYAFSGDLPRVWASSVDLAGSEWLAAGGIVVLLGGAATAFGGGVKSVLNFMMRTLIRPHSGNKPDEARPTMPLISGQVKRVQAPAAEILKQTLSSKDRVHLESLATDRETPYRVIKGLLPVTPSFYRQPLAYMKDQLTGADLHDYQSTLDKCDAICAGVLAYLGAEPRLRYQDEDGKPLAVDRYLDVNGQETQDVDLSDVYLRFHQSTVDLRFPPNASAGDACAYRVYGVIGNFRRTPLDLILVRDVIDVLLGRSEHFAANLQAQIYETARVGPDEILELLCQSEYDKYPPSTERKFKG